MNKQLKILSRTIFTLFIVLFAAVTSVQFVQADALRANPLNQRTTMNALRVERGPILVQGSPVAQSLPSSDEFLFQRNYPNPELYSAVTGYFSHYQGMTGIESAMNSELSGTGDTQFFSRFMRVITGQKPQGSAVELTINKAVQEVAAAAMEGYQGAVIASVPGDGRILALYSTPGFDPNLLSLNSNLEIIENYRQLENDPNQPLLNRAIAGDLYHPGSTYKLITAAAALESGEYTKQSTFKNEKEFKLPESSSKISNASLDICGSGDKVSLETAIALSCNVPIAELAVDMPINAIPEMAKKFGFETEIQIPLTVTPSSAPIPMSQAEAAISSIGQLDVRATPLQMLMVVAGIANGGTIMQPQLIEQVIAPNFKIEKSFEPKVFNVAVSKPTAASLRDMMVKSVSLSEGAAHLAGIPGVTVAGKTGTAENGLDQNGDPNPYTLWFTGFAPAEDPVVAVSVVIEKGGGAQANFVGTSYEIPTSIGKQVMEAVLNQ